MHMDRPWGSNAADQGMLSQALASILARAQSFDASNGPGGRGNLTSHVSLPAFSAAAADALGGNLSSVLIKPQAVAMAASSRGASRKSPFARRACR